MIGSLDSRTFRLHWRESRFPTAFFGKSEHNVLTHTSVSRCLIKWKSSLFSFVLLSSCFLCLTVYLSVLLSICLSVYLSISLSLSVYLSVSTLLYLSSSLSLFSQSLRLLRSCERNRRRTLYDCTKIVTRRSVPRSSAPRPASAMTSSNISRW